MSLFVPGQPPRLKAYRLNTEAIPSRTWDGTNAGDGTILYDYDLFTSFDWTLKPLQASEAGHVPIIGTRRYWLHVLQLNGYITAADVDTYPDGILESVAPNFFMPNRTPARAFGKLHHGFNRPLRFFSGLTPRMIGLETHLDFLDEHGIFYYGVFPLGDSEIQTGHFDPPPPDTGYALNWLTHTDRMEGYEAVQVITVSQSNPQTNWDTAIPQLLANWQALFERHLWIIFNSADFPIDVSGVSNKVEISVHAGDLTGGVPESMWWPYLEDFFS